MDKDFIMTVESDDDTPFVDADNEAFEFIGQQHQLLDKQSFNNKKSNNKKSKSIKISSLVNPNEEPNQTAPQINKSFVFDGLAGDVALNAQDDINALNTDSNRPTIDDLIARQREKAKKRKLNNNTDSPVSDEDDDDGSSEDEAEDDDLDESLNEFPDLDEAMQDDLSDDDDLMKSDGDDNKEEDESEASAFEFDDDDDDDSDEDEEDQNNSAAENSDSESIDITAAADKAAQDAEYFSATLSAPKSTNTTTTTHTFSNLPNAPLSRHILLGLKSINLTIPTPVQAQTIPVVLMGKDVVGSSITGSGKTVAFWVGVLERLLLRDKREPRTRVLVVCPTRELAAQVHDVGKAIARYTDIEFCLCVGGLSLKVQEAALKKRPDIVVSTPGRLIDHVRNTNSFTLDSLEILIIDEADRILEEGFRDELTEIVKSCPANRSTLLFSATITEDVNQLARLSLNKPVRVKVNEAGSVAPGLFQEFIKIKDNLTVSKILAPPTTDSSSSSKHKQQEETKQVRNAREMREAVLVSICRDTAQNKKTIIFFRSKLQAHRMKVVFGLLGISAAELHGNLSQEQRLDALRLFKENRVDYLLATDLASRGLDIKGIEQVINFEMPNSFEIYLHRVGRTARAGKKGRALTLVGEADRKMAKQAIKSSPNTKQTVLPSDLISKVRKQLSNLADDYQIVIEQEKEERMLRKAEMELTRGQNMIKHQEEIQGRPARTWFQSQQDKKASKEIGKQEHNAKFENHKEPTREKLNHRDRRRKEALDEAKASKSSGIASSIRKAKKANQMVRLSRQGESMAPSSSVTSKNKNKKKSSSFSVDKSLKQKKPSAASSSKPRQPKKNTKADLGKRKRR